MRRVSRVSTGIVLLVFAVGLTELPAGESKAKISIDDLTVEYRTNPLGIDTPVPRFSWRIQSEIRRQKQTAYHIIVASATEKLANDRGDLWDSGKVASSQSVLVPYHGRPIASGANCYWKVRAWDRNGKPSEWSKPARFSIGPLSPADWKGEWIGYSGRKRSGAGERWIWFNKGDPAREAPSRTLLFPPRFQLGGGPEDQVRRDSHDCGQ